METNPALQAKLLDLLSTSHATRPILTHLNNDTSWLLSIPIPSPSPSPSQKSHFHILIDPWLSGIATEPPEWFATIAHPTPSAYPTIASVVLLLATISPSHPELDLVVISNWRADHTHLDTLVQVDPNVPVLAEANAAKKIRSWGHFEVVEHLPEFKPETEDWRVKMDLLPPWLGVFLWPSWEMFQDLHFAIVVTISSSVTSMENPEAIVYTPHGVYPETGKLWENAQPSLNVTAWLQGLHEDYFGLKFALGANVALQLVRMMKPKYWIETHDEPHIFTGLPKLILKRVDWTLDQAIEKEREMNGGKELERLESMNLGNGGSLILA